MPKYLRRARTTGVAALLCLGAVGVAACGSSNGSAKSKPAASKPAAPAATTTTTATTTPSTTTSSAASSAAASSVNATLSEYKIVTSPTTAKAGRVVFHVTNSGKLKHQFTIIRTNKTASKVLDNQNPNDDIPGARGEISSIQPGKTKTLVIKHLKPGHYAIVCALPGHYQSGMYADFTVQ